MSPTITTRLGRPVNLETGYIWPPDPAPAGTDQCMYRHLDLTEEQLSSDSRYNCWGFTFLPRRYWIADGSDVDRILEDNCTPVADGDIEVGDVIRYRNSGGYTTHTGRVWQTDGAGHATQVRSKWGGWGEFIHPPLVATLPPSYGSNLAYFRQHWSLNGVADLWIRDSPADDGEQFSHQYWWTSPDILVDIPPYDDTPDLNPRFSVMNRVWARVANRCDTPAENVFLRYYWADPAAGLAPADWNPIAPTAGHPNPAGPFTVPAFGLVDAPYVEWMPIAAPAHQCLLAIAYINDNPRDSDNPDPLVYPFDIPWENNIAQRNVHILPANSGSNHEVSIGLNNPFPERKKYSADVLLELTHAVQLPFASPGRNPALPKIECVLDKKRKFLIKKSGASDILTVLKPSRYPCPRAADTRIAGARITELSFANRPHTLDIAIAIPPNALPGSVYYFHILQEHMGLIVGGYSIAIPVTAPLDLERQAEIRSTNRKQRRIIHE